jgi:hypothetical protein
MVEPFVHDSADTPDAVRLPSNATPYGQSAEHRTQQREQLMGEDVPGYAKSYSEAQGALPGYAPMIDDAGAFSGRGAGMNALSVALLLAAAPAVPAAGASTAAAADAAQAGAARTGGVIAGSYAPKALTGGASRNPYSRAGVSAGASLGTSLLEPAAAVPHAIDFGVARDVLFAPASLVPQAGREAVGAVGRSVLDALPNVAGTSRDVLGALQAQRRSRFRALMRGTVPMASSQVSDPFNLIPDIGGGIR